MNAIRSIQELSKADIKYGRKSGASWHEQYRDTAYIYIGGLNRKMNEGDVVIVFSQYGEIVDCYMGRDEVTGEPKGFCFVAYEDQRSTDLAVDNFNGIELCGRKIKVDHTHFKVPKEFTDPKRQKEEDSDDSNSDSERKLYQPSGPDGKGWGEFRKLNANDLKLLSNEDENFYNKDKQDEGTEKTPIYEGPEELKAPHKIKEESPKINKIDDDERWEKEFSKKFDEEVPQDGNLKELQQKINELKEKKRLKDEKKLLKKEHRSHKKHHHRNRSRSKERHKHKR